MSGTVKWMWGDSERLNSLLWSKAADIVEVLLQMEKYRSSERSVRIYFRGDPPGLQEREMIFPNMELAMNNLSISSEIQGEADAEAIDVAANIDRYRHEQAATNRRESGATWPPPGVTAERCLQCIHCEAKSTSSCDMCGLVLCSQCVRKHPWTAGSNATNRVKACGICTEDAAARSTARAIQRGARADHYRGMLSGEPVRDRAYLQCPPVLKPEPEEESDCAGCGMQFNQMVVGQRRHHCKACARSLCACCFCGSFTCMGTPFSCPHKAMLPQYGYTEQQLVCKDCLPATRTRDRARSVVDSAIQAACSYVDHYNRVATYIKEPDNLPMYEQTYEDTVKSKLVRVGNAAVTGVQLVTPFLSTPAALAVNASSAVWKYGQYGLLGIFCSNEILEGLMTLHSMSGSFQEMDPRELLVGVLYLSAEQRYALRAAPEGQHDEAMQDGQQIDPRLLELLIELAGIGIRAPYEETAYDAQRLALQQSWRPVTERLGESWKHRPAWCLYMHQEHSVACIAIRGTDPDKSAGGDIFTDANALPERAVGADGTVLTAHSGMLASARVLERELRQVVRLLCDSGYKITVVGHSLGAGVASLLLWLFKHGADGEMVSPDATIFGIGYATPSVVDRATADAMRPYFTTVVNSLDLVPRLSAGTVKQLAEQLGECAKDSKLDLGEDVQSHLDRMASLWAPRLRTGKEGDPGRTGSIDEEAKVLPNKVHSFLRKYTKQATDTLTGEKTSKQARDIEMKGSLARRSSAPAVTDSSPSKADADLGISQIADMSSPDEPNVDLPCTLALANVPAADQETLMLECSEGCLLRVLGGVDSVMLAWYGDPSRKWQAVAGKECTEEVQKLLQSSNTFTVSSRTLGDPCEGKQKKLYVLVEAAAQQWDLFCPGVVVWMYRYHGSMQAAEVPCDIPSLRRIVFDKRMVVDHKASCYHRALLTVRARNNAPHPVQWQSFAEAGEYCPCCHNVFEWQSTGTSKKQRWLAMTNCRLCGLVVCTACASTREAVQSAGILDPARICDSCAMRGHSGNRPGAALGALTEILSAAASRSTAKAIASA